MAFDGGFKLGGGAPSPDPERIGAVRDELVGADAARHEGFGEEARQAVVAGLDRLSAELKSADLDDCAHALERVRDRLAALEPNSLTPRGWFDSRGKRLKRFRLQFQDAWRELAEHGGTLSARAGSIGQREGRVESVLTDLRAAIAELDAWIAGGIEALRRTHAPQAAAATAPVELQSGAEAPVEAVPQDAPSEPAEPEASAEPATPVDQQPAPEAVSRPEDQPAETDGGATEAAQTPDPEPDPQDRLRERLAALVETRDAAVRSLPVARAIQNAEWRTPEALRAAGQALEDWRDRWTCDLGLGGKKPRKVRPEPRLLAEAKQVLADACAAAEGALATARARRVEIESRRRT